LNGSQKWPRRAASPPARLPSARHQAPQRLRARTSLATALLAACTTAGLFAGFGCSALFPTSPDPPPPPPPWQNYPVQLNTVGFLPERAKLATVVSPGGTTFDIYDVNDPSTPAWSGALGDPLTDPETNEKYWLADFSAFTTVGTYYLDVPGAGTSATFKIDPDVYKDTLPVVMLGLTGARCGTSVNFSNDVTTPDTLADGGLSTHGTAHTDHFSHKACHTRDANLDVISNQDAIKPSQHGWHDAGDYGKYTTNAAFAVGMLLEAWDHFQPTLSTLSLPKVPEHGGAFPDFLAEVKWELDWLLTMQFDGGGVAFKVTAFQFEGFVLPEDDGQLRYFAPIGSGATADFAAVMAMASRIYRTYDAAFADTCLTAATAAYGYLANNPLNVIPDQSKFSTGTYADSSDADERLWAAAEMWEATGDSAALADFEQRAATPAVDAGFDWPHVSNLGYFTYALSQQTGRDPVRVAAVDAAIIASADDIVTNTSAQAYGRGIPTYYWGSAGVVVRNSMNLWVANVLASTAAAADQPAPGNKYLDAMVSQIDYVFGRNPFGRSLVTAIGYHPPLHPHHRPSASDNVVDPWPGLLVGGPQSSGAQAWQDTQDDFNVNEVAINWTAALVYATSAFSQ
jgi:endoglucanase